MSIFNIFDIKVNKYGTQYVVTEEIQYNITISILQVFRIYNYEIYIFDHND